jgi:hypothetical protein
MSGRILNYLRTQHLGLIALVLVVAGGTAYAAGLTKNSVKSKHIKNNMVKSADVKDQALTGIDVADNSIGPLELLDGGVGSAEIASSAVTSDELANDSVIGQKIATGVIGGGKISPGAIGTNKLEDGAVNSAKVADGSIGAVDLDATVGRIGSKTGVLTVGAAAQDVLVVNGFGTFSIECPAADNFEIDYTRDPTIAQTMSVLGQDPADPGPRGTSESTGAGVGFGSGTLEALDGYVWAFTAERALRIDYLVRPHAAGECSYYLRATLSPNLP